MDPFELLRSYAIGLDLIYSIVLVTCCFMIYHATKEMYELSSHKGLKYFRSAFLFFGLAYLFRYLIRAIFVVLDLHDIIQLYPYVLGTLSLLLFLYFSTMGIFYLLYSVMWKKWNHEKNRIYLFNALSALIAVIGTVFRLVVVHLLLNVILLVLVLFVLLMAYRESRNRQKGNLYVTYLLFSIFWFLSIVDLLLPRFLELFRLEIYSVSVVIFMCILYKVLRKAGS